MKAKGEINRKKQEKQSEKNRINTKVVSRGAKEKKQKKRIFGIVAATILMMAAAEYEDKENSILSENGTLSRGQPGTGSQNVELEIEVPELEEILSYQMELSERQYTETEREELFETAKKEIDQTFSPSGEEMDHITRQVYLPDTLAGGKVSVAWSFEDSQVIEVDGTIQTAHLSEEGTLVNVTAQLSYGVYECLYTFACYVYPEEIDSPQALLRKVTQVLAEKEQTDLEDAEVILPKELAGYTLHWMQKKPHTPLLILLLGSSAVMAVIWMEREQVRRKEVKRRRQLQMEYPQMVAKLALLLGAGMSTKQAWRRLCENYFRQRECGNCRYSELYEQMQITARQMRDGIGESEAYEQFGERSGLSLYRRFSMMLVQNLKKGNAGLILAMEAEADRAFEERKNNAKRLGEEAGTKLLIPMLVMLAIVIIILMVPAVLTMQI